MVTVRQLTAPGAPQPSAMLDLTVWRPAPGPALAVLAGCAALSRGHRGADRHRITRADHPRSDRAEPTRGDGRVEVRNSA